MIRLTKTYISILLLILMFGAIIYSLLNAGSSKLMLGFGIVSMFCIIKSGQGLSFWSRWVSSSPSPNETTILESIKIELASTPLNQRENKRDSLLTILHFHKYLFNVVFSIFFSMIIVGLYFLIEDSELFDRAYLIGSIILFSFGLWWWCQKTYPSDHRNEIKYSARILSKSNWEENPILKSIAPDNDKWKERSETFNDYWIPQNITLDEVIGLINIESPCFEFRDGKWIIIKGSRSKASKRNLAGFVKTLIEVGCLKTSISSTLEDAQNLKEVFLFADISSGKELQEFYGQRFEELPGHYVAFFRERFPKMS